MLTRQQLVYLVGPITGCSYQGCTEWRDGVKAELQSVKHRVKGSESTHPHDAVDLPLYHVLTPMRGKEFLSNETEIKSTGYEGIAADKAVYRRDSSDVDRCDILLCNLLGSKIASIGSVMEIARAEKAGKFIVTVMEEGNVHEHCFVKQASSLVFRDLDDAVKYLKNVYNS